jgi:septum site-determining protein MinD
MSRIIGIFSGKGGVGKTTCSFNIGVVMHNLGEKVILIDCNMRNSNLALHMGAYDVSSTLHDVMENDISLMESIHIHSSGLRFIPSSVPTKQSNFDLTRLREKLSDIDYTTILDSPPGTGDDVISLLRLSDEIVVVTNPEIPSITDALKMIQLAIDMEKHVAGVIVNRVSGKNEVSIDSISKVCRAPVIGVIPEDKNVKLSLHKRKPVVLIKPHSPASLAFKSIGHKLIGREYRPSSLSKVRRLF